MAYRKKVYGKIGDKTRYLSNKEVAGSARNDIGFWKVRGGDAGLVVHSYERGIAKRTGGHAPQERVNRRFPEPNVIPS